MITFLHGPALPASWRPSACFVESALVIMCNIGIPTSSSSVTLGSHDWPLIWSRSSKLQVSSSDFGQTVLVLTTLPYSRRNIAQMQTRIARRPCAISACIMRAPTPAERCKPLLLLVLPLLPPRSSEGADVLGTGSAEVGTVIARSFFATVP